jgi:ribokinase
MSIVSLGSANHDLVYRVAVLPGPGETVLATGVERHLGGKGNNQAVAAARAGADTTFIAAVGRDQAADKIISGLAEAGITALVRRLDGRTGTALITVDENGENVIIVDAGANASLTDLTDDELAAIAEADILLMQLEVPVTTVAAAAGHARDHGTLVVLNAAPMQPLPAELLRLVDLLIVNQTEAAELIGDRSRDDLLNLVPAAIVTLGAEGAWIGVRGQGSRTVPGRPVQVVDTTGAGDTFCGALVAELDRVGSETARSLDDLAKATEFATAAAALAVQRDGAVSSIPMLAEIRSAL